MSCEINMAKKNLGKMPVYKRLYASFICNNEENVNICPLNALVEHAASRTSLLVLLLTR